MYDTEVVILGAGFAGLCAAIKLKRSGNDSFVVLEKSEGIGGTWNENTYPGVECDVPSHLYSYSFLLNPYWTKSYAPGAEIREYLRWCAEQEGIMPHIQLRSACERAIWAGDHWEVTTSTGGLLNCRYLVAGLGGLHTPNIPEVDGLGSFAGPMFHTSRWDHSVDLAGQRVAMIGTGSTAVQAAPKVAETAASLHLFQRTPIWVSPKRDKPYEPEVQAEFASDPSTMRRHRWDLWNRWEGNGNDMFRAGTEANMAGQAAALKNLTENVNDPELVAKLTPNYNITCKRPTFSSTFYPMFNRENVHLVVDGIERITERGVVVNGPEGEREIEVDVIVLATGFRPFDITTEVDIRGIDGLSLERAWAERITSYRSIMVAGFPNLFVLLGPNSAGLTSAVQMIESGVDFFQRAVQHVDTTGVTGLHPLPEAIAEFTQTIDEITAGTTVNQGCSSWWTASGHNHSLWPESSVAYRMMMNDFRPEDFEFVSETTVKGSHDRVI